MKKLFIIGQGGHSKVVTDMVKAQGDYEIIGYLDDYYKEMKKDGELIYAPISFFSCFSKDELIYFVIAIGNNIVRKRITEALQLPYSKYATIIHPTAVISSSSMVGKGSVVMPYSVVNANSKIGEHAIINTGAIVEHDNLIGDFVHLSPNVTLTGTVHIEEGTHLGAGSTVIPGRIIGSWATVGAGATVVCDIGNGDTVIGTPAKSIKGRD
ncbi:acetyltransferase [Priestia megaterium]|uniref:acetyltransferase n=1 Tax=Priestia megaterium TaxID=1404 RepID=UPI0020797866|nr:acetyltransferase [Priestia megaterium]USL25730.1 acetyltransferase [Priestia megaterium]